MKALSITVIIPTWRPDDRFRKLVRRLHRQSVPPEKILIINTEKDQFNPEDVRGIPEAEVIHIEKEEFDHGGTRAYGASLADTDLLVFMTQDAVPADTKLLENLTHGFDDDDVAAVYARQLAPKSASAIEKVTRAFSYGPVTVKKKAADIPEMGVKTFFCSNVCAAYRRDVYGELGGFEEHAIFNEDMVFAAKLIKNGYAVVYEADACVFHSHDYSGRQQFRRNFDLGVSQAQHPEIFEGVSSESEGVRYVRAAIRKLFRSGHMLAIPKFVWLCGCRYLGYKAGRNYRKLPDFLIRAFTANPGYWDADEGEDD